MSPSISARPKAEVEVPLYQDPWNPVLVNSPNLVVSPEQDKWLREILELSCSDSAFAKKAYTAITLILTGTPGVPVLTSLNPATAVQEEVVTVSVIGTGFSESSVVRASGAVQTSTFVSPTELTFIPDTTLALTHDVYVENYPNNSNVLTFEVTAPALLSVKEPKEPVKKIELGPELTKRREEIELNSPPIQDKK